MLMKHFSSCKHHPTIILRNVRVILWLHSYGSAHQKQLFQDRPVSICVPYHYKPNYGDQSCIKSQ